MNWLPVLMVLIIPVIEIPLIIHFIKKYINKKYEIEKENLSQSLRQFISPGENGQPSQLAEIVHELSPVIAQQIYKSLTASFKANQAAVSKNLDNANDDIMTEALAGQSPMMALAMQLIPKKWKNRIANNPGLLSGLTGLPGSGSAGSGNGNGHYERKVHHR